MGYEVEIKYRVPDHADLAARLAAAGASAGPAVDNTDLYLAHPSRDFAQTGEAFRIRSEGEGNAVTYKGPKQGGTAKTREEIEVSFDPGASARSQMAEVFDRLGFRPVATVAKTRISYHLDDGGRAMSVTLDDAGELGLFAEVETLVDGAGDLPAAQAAVNDLARRLGLSEVEPRSYLRMLLERRGIMPGKSPGQT
ncbi:class IV adenylate cyclase [Tundrisphaera sp. TA3]|uniref:class IV adenylate cyclase n=1 Tax=Tundrisphaera sp. TA3 TaxID=3435775 RepID=UPI003EBC8266